MNVDGRSAIEFLKLAVMAERAKSKLPYRHGTETPPVGGVYPTIDPAVSTMPVESSEYDKKGGNNG